MHSMTKYYIGWKPSNQRFQPTINFEVVNGQCGSKIVNYNVMTHVDSEKITIFPYLQPILPIWGIKFSIFLKKQHYLEYLICD